MAKGVLCAGSAPGPVNRAEAYHDVSHCRIETIHKEEYFVLVYFLSRTSYRTATLTAT